MRYNKSMKREALFTTKLKKWLESDKSFNLFASAIEVKVTTGKSIPFSDVKEHQIAALRAVKHGSFCYKIPDAGWQNPFDLILFNKHPYSFIVLCWEKQTKPRYTFYFVDIDMFLLLQEAGDRSSVTEDMLAGVGLKPHTF